MQTLLYQQSRQHKFSIYLFNIGLLYMYLFMYTISILPKMDILVIFTQRACTLDSIVIKHCALICSAFVIVHMHRYITNPLCNTHQRKVYVVYFPTVTMFTCSLAFKVLKTGMHGHFGPQCTQPVHISAHTTQWTLICHVGYPQKALTMCYIKLNKLDL